MEYLSTIAVIAASAALIATGAVGWIVFGIRKQAKRIFGANPLPENTQSELLRRIARLEAKLELVEPRVEILEGVAKVSVQKVGFLRFNPFQDTGGDNSFVMALLDANDNGIIISSLYTREGIRLYGKKIEKGSSKNVLSDEEKKVLADAINQVPEK